MSDWKNDLAGVFESKKKEEAAADPKQQQAARAKAFLSTVVVPAFEEFKVEVVKHGRQVQVQAAKADTAGLTVMSRQGNEFDCTVELRSKPDGTQVPVFRERSLEAGSRYFSEEFLAQGMATTKEQFLQFLVFRYKQKLSPKR